jgi:hypothetical protein
MDTYGKNENSGKEYCIELTIELTFFHTYN